MLLPHLSQASYKCFPSTPNPGKIQGAFWLLTVLFVQKRAIYSSLVIIRMHIYETGSIKKIPRTQEIRVLTDQPSDSSTNALIFCPKILGALIFSISLEKSDCYIYTIQVQTALIYHCLHYHSKYRTDVFNSPHSL